MLRKTTVELHKGWAYVDIGAGYLLAIGTEEEVKTASVERITEMIEEAVKIRQYNSIEDGTSRTLH